MYYFFKLKRSKFIYWGPFQITFTLVLYAFAQTLIFGSRFGTNDDVGMVQIANGGITGKPSQYLIFINVALGYILKLGYQSIPSVQWYPLLQILSMSFAFAIFIRIARDNFKFHTDRTAYFRFALPLISVLVIAPKFIVWTYAINYNTTAYFCSVLGITSLVFSLRLRPNSLCISPLFICLLGYSWRPQVFISVIPIFILILITQIRFIPLKALLRIVSFLTVTVLFLSFLDQLAYTFSSTWKTFYHYNLLRGTVHGNIDFGHLVAENGFREIALKLQLPEINLRLFGRWFFSSATTPSESLTLAVDLIRANTLLSSIELGQTALNQLFFIVLKIAPLIILSTLIGIAKRALFFFLLMLILLYVLLAESYLEKFIRLPIYIIDGLHFSAVLGSMSLFALVLFSAQDTIRPKAACRTFLLFALIPLVLDGSRLIQEIPFDSSRSERLHETSLVTAQELQKTATLPTVDFTGLIDLTSTSPWSRFKFTSLKLIPTGWIMSSPHQESRLHYFGINESLDAALTEGRISVLSPQDSLDLLDLAQYLYVNYSVCGIWDSASITFLDQPVLLSVFRESEECSSVVNSDPQLEQGEIFYTNDELHLEISTCMDGVTQNQISFKAHSPFGSYAKDFRIKINYLGPFMAPTARYVTVKPGGSQPLTVKTWGCDVQITSLSAPVIPFEVNPKIPDRRTLFVGISDLRILDK
jgi:hypothetical protein